MNFDTHAAVKRLIAVGLQDRVAEEVVSSIAHSRDYDFSKLVAKEEFFKFREEFSEHKQEVSERFNKIENEIALIKQEIKVSRKELKADIETLRKEARTDNEILRNELKADIKELDNKINILRKDQETGFARLSAEIANSKHDTLKWVMGLFVIQVTSMVGFFVTILIKSYF